MADTTEYTPPKVWTWNKEKDGGRFARINRPVAGPTHEKELPVGKHPLQLYSLATPNGVKVTVMFEELLGAGHNGAEYDAWLIKISDGEQFGSGFVAINPNSKIPALLDRSTKTPTRIFESAPCCFTRRKVRRHSCRTILTSAPSATPGCSGRWRGALSRRRLRSLLRLCAGEDRIRDQPDAMEIKRQLDVLDRTWPTANTSQATNTPSPTWRSGPGTAPWRGPALQRRRVPSGARTTRTSCAGPREIGDTPGRQAWPDCQPRLGRRRGNFPNGTMPAISTR